MSEKMLTISLSPHAKSPISTKHIMWMVVLALIPALVNSVVVFGPRALLVYGVALLSALLAEFLLARFLLPAAKTKLVLARGNQSEDKSLTLTDGSAVITALLLAMNLPAGIPLWEVALGAVFAISLGKMVFGGLGNNPFNPALAGRAFMLASFPKDMTVFPAPYAWHKVQDAVSAATPLGSVKEGVGQGLSVQTMSLPSLSDLFLGNVGGCLGEVSALLLLVGGVFLIVSRVISWRMPVFYLLGLSLITGLVWLINPAENLSPLYHLFSGGAILAAFFMVTDMVTSPMNKYGQIVFALGAGIIAACIRLFGSYPEGASYAILFMNALVPLIDRAFRSKRFAGPMLNPGVKETK